jgi:hypothetical protein
VTAPWDPASKNALGMEVAGALASFWADGQGPSGASLASAFALAGVEDVGGNKQDRVRLALRNAPDAAAMRLVEELLDLLRNDGAFEAQDPKVARLRSSLERRSATLSAEGYVDWADASSTASPAAKAVSRAHPPQPSAGVSARGAAPPGAVLAEVPVPNLEMLMGILRRLPAALRPLRVKRRRGRAPLGIADEYDLQDVAETALRLVYRDVRPEERTPSSGGSSSQIDLLVKAERCAVEIKVTRPGRGAREIKPELLVDINDYTGHPTVDTLVVAIYDLADTFDNPTGFEQDFSRRHDDLEVHVIVVGWPASAT